MTIPEIPKPNTARDLLLIHRIITRALEVTPQKGQEYLATGFTDAVVRQGYHDYIHCMVSVLDAHHLTEDEVVFTQLGIRISSAPCGLLSADHQKMVILLDDITDILFTVTVRYATIAGAVAGAAATANQIAALSSAGMTAPLFFGSIGAEMLSLSQIQMRLVLDLSVKMF